jgi:dienelactone hydrolase
MKRLSPLFACALLVACDGAAPARGTADTDIDADADVEDGVVDGGDDDGAVDDIDDDGDDDGVVDGGPVASRCVEDADGARCTYETLALAADVTGLVERDVHFQRPFGPAPLGGFPTVILFQGSLYSAERSFAATPDETFGALHQTRLVKALLDGGYAVLAPEAHLDGSTYWDTNVPPYSLAWSIAPDHTFMEAIFAAIDAGDFGDLDGDALFATGISSGGFMTSRMAVSYAGRFRALAIHSGSYATCSALCLLPSLPEDHAPTLFMTGADDALVPLSTVLDYEAALRDITETELVVVEGAGHEWLPGAPTAIPAFFNRHR